MVKIGKDSWALQGSINRRLSWRECALLQSFTAEIVGQPFEPEGVLKAKYAQIGNAVPPLMAYLIVKPIADFLDGRANAQEVLHV